jgi:CRP-like cAMP-binding protein
MKNNHRPAPHGMLDESLLTQLPPFSKLTTEQIREILDQATSRRYDAGLAVFEEGHDAERFYMMLDGYVRVQRMSEQGERVITLHIPSGELFGIAAAFGRTTYPASAITAVEAIVLSWPMHFWADFTQAYDGFATETYKTVGHRMDEMSTRILELATQQVEQRIASAILRMINQSGRKVDQGIKIDFPITRQNLSEMTGATLHTVSRTLSGWERAGIIESQRKHITVCEPHQLVILSGAKLAGEAPR